MGLTKGDFDELRGCCCSILFGISIKPLLAATLTGAISESINGRIFKSLATAGFLGGFSFAFLQNLFGNLFYTFVLKQNDLFSPTQWDRVIISHIIVGSTMGSLVLLAAKVSGTASLTLSGMAALVGIGLGIEVALRSSWNAIA